jgi:sodium-dependent dicarboxylate transporter 2/3/5
VSDVRTFFQLLVVVVGTGPNLVFFALYRQMYSAAPEISFGTWMLFAMPCSFLILISLWL